MAVPEDRGGWGASLLDLALVAELVGRAAAPAPVVEAQVAARLLAAVGSAADLDPLGPVLDGEQLVTVVLREPVAGHRRARPGRCGVRRSWWSSHAMRSDSCPVADADRTVVANLASAPLADVRLAEGERPG